MNNQNDYNDNKKVTYHEQTDISNILKLREVLKTLPPFCRDYFRAMDPVTTTNTRMPMTYGSFSSFYWMKTLPLKITL